MKPPHVRRFHADLRLGSADLFLDPSGPPLNLRPRYDGAMGRNAAVVRQIVTVATGFRCRAEARSPPGPGIRHRPQAHQRAPGDGAVAAR